MKSLIIKILALSAITGLCAATGSFASTMGGQWGNAVYVYRDRLDTARSIAKVYENLSLYAEKIAGSDFSVYTDLLFTNRYDFDRRKAFEIGHLYLDWANSDQPFELRLGRQRVFHAVDPRYIDGARMRLKLGEILTVVASGGVQLPSRHVPEHITTDADSADIDISIRALSTLGNSRIGAAYQQGLTSEGSTRRIVGVDLRHFFGDRASAYGDFAFDLVEMSPYEYHVDAIAYLTDNVHIGLDALGDFRTIDSAALISSLRVFTDYQEFGVSGGYAFTRDATMDLGYYYRILQKASPAQGIDCRLSIGPVWAGYTHEWGHGGKALGADAGAEVFQTGPLTSRVSASYLRYTTASDGSKAQHAWMAQVSNTIHPPSSWWNVKLDFQALGNPYYDYDLRAFVGTDVRFSRFVK